MYVSRANCLVSLPWEDCFSYSPLSVRSRVFPLSYLHLDSVPRIQCLDSAPRSLNCFLSSLRLSKVTIQSPVSLITADKTGIRGLSAEALVDGGPCSFPLSDSRVDTVSHSCRCLSTQGTPGCMPDRSDPMIGSLQCSLLELKLGLNKKQFTTLYFECSSQICLPASSTPPPSSPYKPWALQVWQNWVKERLCALVSSSYCATSQPGALGESILYKTCFVQEETKTDSFPRLAVHHCKQRLQISHNSISKHTLGFLVLICIYFHDA